MDSMSFPCLQHTKERSGKVTLPFLDDHSCCCQTAISLWLNGLHLICVAQKRWDSCKALERLVLMGDWAEGRSPFSYRPTEAVFSLSLQPLDKTKIKAARLSGFVMAAKYVCRNGTLLL